MTADNTPPIELVEVSSGASAPALPSHPQGYGGAASSERLQGESLLAIVTNYLNYYAAGAGHTARAKRYDLQYFLEFLAGTAGRVDQLVVSDWTMQSTKDFIDERLSAGEAPATVSRRLATIKHFGRTLAERVPGYVNPAREVKSPTLAPTRPHGLDEESISYLLQAAEQAVNRAPNSFNAHRNQFILELLLATGLRADEIRLLVFSQISDDHSWLKNVKTKGKKFRNVYLNSEIRHRLESYLEHRTTLLRERFPLLAEQPATQMARFPVIISLYGADISKPHSFGMSPKSLWRVVSELGTQAQALSPAPVGNLHPHRLRHTFAHGLLDSSKDVRLVAQALGHSDVRTTMRYTERTEDEIASAIEEQLRNS